LRAAIKELKVEKIEGGSFGFKLIVKKSILKDGFQDLVGLFIL